MDTAWSCGNRWRWTPRRRDLVMRCVLLLSLSMLVGGGLPAQQIPASPREFAVATIKPSAQDTPPLTQIRGNRFATEGTTFVDVFKYAYNVQPNEIVGGPEWLRTEKFDILADPETEKRPSSDEMKAMVQRLLVERFHVAMHKEQKVLSVYALQKAVDSPKLTKSAGNEGGIPAVGYDPRGELEVGNATMTNFAGFLQRFVLDRPAVDQTGIEGRFDLVLRWTPDDVRGGGSAGDAGAEPELFTAMKEQLGLKLQATKAGVDVFVVDRAEKPEVD